MSDWRDNKYEDRDYGVGGQPGGYSSEGEDFVMLAGCLAPVLLIVGSIAAIAYSMIF
jgi:hypothetical protein